MNLAHNCLECGTPLRGRRDKKFCNESCRNQFHNHVNADQSQTIREINNGLRRNRRILIELVQQGKKTIQRSILARKGFDFELITAMQEKRSGTHCYCCYEYGYIPLDENRFQLIELLPK